MQSDILNTEVTTIDGEKPRWKATGQGAAHRERGVEMWPYAAV